ENPPMKRSAITFAAITALALAGAGLANAGLAGCGGASNNNAGSTGGKAAANPTFAGLTGAAKASGATFPDAYYQEVITQFKGAAPNATVTYNAVGSGTGKKEFGQGLTDFAGSDSTVKPTDGIAAGSFLYVPTVAAPIAVVYNVSGLDDLQLT